MVPADEPERPHFPRPHAGLLALHRTRGFRLGVSGWLASLHARITLGGYLCHQARGPVHRGGYDPMKRSAIIHVGLEKTGSTAIQAWLDSERHALLKAGLFVPRSLGRPNHWRLVAACLDDWAVDDIKAYFLSQTREPEAEWRDSVRAAFDAELATVKGWSQLVISSELITSRLHTPTEIARLAEWIGQHVDRLHFVVYLRRQDDLAVSRFSSALRAGHAGFDDIWSDLSANSFLALPPGRVVKDELEYFDHQRILARFLALGDAELTVRAYDPPGPPMDVVADFRALLGLSPASTAAPAQRSNPALSAEAQYVISQLNRDNRVRWPNGARNEPYRALLHRIEAELQGSPRRVPRAEAEAFLARFEASNAAVERRWFQNGMFRSGFSQWPETVDHSAMIAEMTPVLARYRAEAAALPQMEAPRPVSGRLSPRPARPKRSTGGFGNRLTDRLFRLMEELQRREALAALSTKLPPQDPTIVLARVIGNDLWPRHAQGQSLQNLEFMLTREPTFGGYRKLFVLNRIIDAGIVAQAESMIRQAGHDVLTLPFDPVAYTALRMDTSYFGGDAYFMTQTFARKSNYERVHARLWAASPKIRNAMDVNGGRNAALDWGKARADWTLVLDGNCFLTSEAMQALRADLTRPPFTSYVSLPMHRLSRNEDAFTTRPEPNATEEPQLVFSASAKGRFDEAFPYGMRDKTSLLKQVGVPGEWDHWGELPWLPASAPLRDRHSWKTASTAVFRLSSGAENGKLELPGADKIRFQSRNRAIFLTLAALDARLDSADHQRMCAILGLGENVA
ncbi:MAG: hypothetical protein C0524_14150 [Rhodobacter sp.]|nr:hypothetical protein [Rhodobacter sp.]